MRNEPLHAGHERESAKRTGRRDKPKPRGAFFRGHDPSDRTEDYDIGNATQGNAHQRAEHSVEAPRRADRRHQIKTNGIEQRAASNDPSRAKIIGDKAQYGQAENEVLPSDGKAKHFAPHAEVSADRRQKKAKGLANAHADEHDEGTAKDNDSRFVMRHRLFVFCSALLSHGNFAIIRTHKQKERTMNPSAEERLRNPRPNSAIARARDFGIDLTLLIERSRLTAEERVARLQREMIALDQIRGRAKK